MDSSTSKDLIDELFNVRLVLTGLLFAFIYIGVMLTLMLKLARKRSEGLILSEASRAFQAKAAGLLSRADYQTLKNIASERERENPGDSLAIYYLGMGHFRCGEYVPAKRCFDLLLKLDASWKKVAPSILKR